MKKEKKKKSIFNKIIDIIIIVLLIFILLYFGNIGYKYYKIPRQEAQALSDIKGMYGNEWCVNGEVNSSKVTPDVSKLVINEAFGYIEVPSVGIGAAIYEGDKADDYAEAMSSGVAHNPASSLPTINGDFETIITGHRDFEFGKLETIQQGADIILNIQGEIYVYRVTSTEIIHETEVEKVIYNSAKDELVLFTCYPFSVFAPANDRFVVKAELISTSTC